jgi:lipoprotein signal peptidase
MNASGYNNNNNIITIVITTIIIIIIIIIIITTGLPNVLQLGLPEIPYFNNGHYIVEPFNVGILSGIVTLWQVIIIMIITIIIVIIIIIFIIRSLS